MSAVAANVAPIFILILIGWLTVKAGLFRADAGDILSDFVFKIAVPTLIFRTLAEANFHGASPFRLWITYFAGVAVTWTVGHIVTRYVFKQDVRIAVIAGISSAFANNIFIGLPLVGRSVGDEGLVALSILLAIHLPVMMIAGTILMENATHKAVGGEKRGMAAVFKQVGRNLVTNPLVIGLAIGLSTNVSGVALTPILKTVVDQVASMAGPAALISLGMALTKYSRQYGHRRHHDRFQAAASARLRMGHGPRARPQPRMDGGAGAHLVGADGRECMADRQPLRYRPQCRGLHHQHLHSDRRSVRVAMGLAAELILVISGRSGS
jgi:predicted permease